MKKHVHAHFFKRLLLIFTFTSVMACAAFAQSPFISSTPGTTTWTVPYGVTSITIETWGAGGTGGGSTGAGAGGGGGGGGYNTTTMSGLTYGTVYSYTVGGGTAGTSGTGSTGGSTSFNSGTIATGGVGGVGGTASYGAGGAGGTGSKSGGTGGTASSPNSGGGGGSAGNGSNGGNGGSLTAGTAGTAGTGTAGAAGATGVSANGNGAAGTVPGSGGSGGKGSGKLGGAGANGQVKITYSQPCTAPPGQPTSLLLTSVLSTSITGNFTASAYTDGYLVVRTPTSSAPTNPSNNTTYIAGNTLGTGTVVSSGGTTSFTSASLTAHTQYWFWVYAFNNSPCTGGITYLTASPLSTSGYTLCSAPANSPTSLTFPTVTYNSISGSYTAAAGADGYLVIQMTSSTTVTSPTNGTTYTVGTSALGGTVVQAGAGTTFTSSGLAANTGYWYTVFSMNFTTCYGPVYKTTTPLKNNTTTLMAPCAAPTAQPTSLILTGASTTSVGGSFTAEASAYGYLVIRTTTSSAPTNPVDGSTYTVGASALGGIVIAAGTATSFTSSGLTANTPYWYWVYSYNDVVCSGGIKYYTPSPLSGVGYTACVAPTAQPTVLNLTPTYNSIAGSFTPAAGADGYLVIRMTSSTNPTNPVNGTVYTVGTTALGGYVEMAGAGTSFTSTSLSPTTQYWYTIFSYNFNTCLTVAYRTATPLKANTTTLQTPCSTPSAQPTSLVFGTVYSESLSASFTAASPVADGYLVVRTTTSSAPSSPVDGTTYTVGTTALGGVIESAGAAVSFTSSSLTAGTQYWYWVYSYTANGACSGIAYKSASPLSGNTTTAAVGFWTNTATITTPGTATYNYSALTWGLGHIPTSSENAEIVLNLSTGTAGVVSIALDTSCTVYSYKMRNISSSPYVNILQTNGSVKYQVTTNMTMSCTGANKWDRSVFANEDTTIINGDLILGSTTPGATEGHSAIGSTASNPNQTYIMYGDMYFNKKGYTTDEHAVFIFDKAGTQHIYNNTTVTDTVAPVLFEMLYVGLTHATNLVFAGATHDAYIENVRAGGVVIGANSTLDLPADYSMGKFSGGFAETISLGAGAKLRLGGYRGVDLNNSPVGLAGSNFPYNFNTITLDANSTVEYYGDNTMTQTIYSGATYGKLLITNGAGTGRAAKNTTGAITANTSININAIADVTLGSTVSSAGPFNVNATGGLYCAANVVSGAGAFTLASTAYLGMGHAQGISSGSTAAGNIQMMGGRSFSTGANYIYNGSVTQITGNGLPTTCNDLTIDNPTTVTIANSQSVTGINALKQGVFDIGTNRITITGTGTLTSITGKMKANVGALEMNGSSGSVQNLDGSWFVNKNISTLINSNTTGITLAATANDTLLVSSALLYGTGTTNSAITTNGNLTLLSRDTATARFGEIVTGSGNTITGNVNVERYVSTNRKWRLLGWNTTSTQTAQQNWMENNSPNGDLTHGYGTIVTDEQATWSANGFDSRSVSGPSVKYYNPTTNNYTGITNTSSFQMNSKSAYFNFVRGDRSCLPSNSNTSTTVLRSTGTLKTGDQSHVIPAGLFDAVGNPYASAIDIRKLDTVNLTTTFYVWDPKLSGIYGLGAYQTVYASGTNYKVLPGGGSYGPLNSFVDTIESGQGFFARAKASAGTITFHENAKTIGARTMSRDPVVSTTADIYSLLSVVDPGGNTLVDGAMGEFDAAYSDAVDYDDALKMVNTSENVSFKRDGQLLAIERRQNITHDDTLFVNVTGYRIHQYQWDISFDNMAAPGRTAFLIDNYLGTTTALDVTANNAIQYTVENVPASYAANRFIIVFKQTAVLPVRFTSISATRNTDKTVTVRWNTENEINMQDYKIQHSNDGIHFTDIGTQLPSSTSGGSASYSFIDTHAGMGNNYYRIKGNSLNGQVQYTAIVKVGPLGTANPTLSVYPNPVTDGNVNLHFENEPKGTYSVSISNTLGQILHTETVQATNDNFVRMISFGDKAAPGSYQVTVVDGSGKKVSIGFIIEK